MTLEVGLALALLIVGLYLWYRLVSEVLDWIEHRTSAERRRINRCSWVDCPMSAKAHTREEHGSWLPNQTR